MPLLEINKTSNITVYRARNTQTVQDMLQRLDLQTNYFAVLINGKKASPLDEIKTNDDVIVLPKIAGGTSD